MGRAATSCTQPHKPHSSHHTPAARRRSNLFPEGSLVEVRNNEPDFRDTYFSATVVSRVVNYPKKGSQQNTRKITVQYHDLFEEDKSTPLKEQVSIQCLRPSPAFQEVVEGFVPGDEVDAFFQEGWWIGVVERVVEGEKRRYVVTFQNPPDEREFGFWELRVHWDWDNGNWVRSGRQSATGLMFDVGAKVEVSFDKENHLGVWFPGTIHQHLTNGTYLVECCNANSDEGTKTEIVDSLHLRPCPPLLKYNNFNLLEQVDAFFDFGWWSGIIKQESENNRYTVFFKELNMEKEFNQSELRSHVHWKDGKWFTSSQVLLIPSSKGGMCELLACENPIASVPTAPVSNSGDGKRSDLVDALPKLQKMPHVTSLTKRRRHISNSLIACSQVQNNLKKGNALGQNQQESHDKSIQKNTTGFVSSVSRNIVLAVENQSAMRGLSSDNPSSAKRIEKKTLNKDKAINGGSDTKDRKKNSTRKREDKVVEESINPQESHVPKRGRRHGTVLQVQDLVGASEGKSGEVNSTSVVNAASHDFENQPLSKWVEWRRIPSASPVDISKSPPLSAVEQPVEKGEKNQRDISVVEEVSEKHQESEVSIPTMVDKQPSVVLMEPQNLPFLKKSLLWKIIEDMDVLQRIPQNPHFQPLEHIKESLREGKAIGYMVTFASVVGKIYELQFDDPKSVTDDILEALAELEMHGFNVRPVQDRVAKFIAAKEKEVNLVGDVKELNNRILEHHQEKDKIEKEIDVIKEEIRKLEEKLSVAESAKGKEEGKIASLGDQLKETEENIEKLRREFEGAVSSAF